MEKDVQDKYCVLLINNEQLFSKNMMDMKKAVISLIILKKIAVFVPLNSTINSQIQWFVLLNFLILVND